MPLQVEINWVKSGGLGGQSTATNPVAWKLPFSPTAHAETILIYEDF